MPYIPQGRRGDLIDHLSFGGAPITPGELNFAITMLIVKYSLYNGKCYATINDILGALEGAKLEFYRRVVAPYEDEKIKQNGDVYP